jgi:hypothetical protein
MMPELKTERTSSSHTKLEAYLLLQGELLPCELQHQTALSEDFVELSGLEKWYD